MSKAFKSFLTLNQEARRLKIPRKFRSTYKDVLEYYNDTSINKRSK